MLTTGDMGTTTAETTLITMLTLLLDSSMMITLALNTSLMPTSTMPTTHMVMGCMVLMQLKATHTLPCMIFHIIQLTQLFLTSLRKQPTMMHQYMLFHTRPLHTMLL
jgi:hypothetical protein